jgi:hypothetical protein
MLTPRKFEFLIFSTLYVSCDHKLSNLQGLVEAVDGVSGSEIPSVMPISIDRAASSSAPEGNQDQYHF